MTDRQYVSPDGQLKLLVIAPDGDLTVGFDGFDWHTHGSILSALSGIGDEEAIERFVSDIVEGRRVIALTRVAATLTQVSVHEDGRSNDQVITESLDSLMRYGEQNETIEFRLWDGTRIETSSVG